MALLAVVRCSPALAIAAEAVIAKIAAITVRILFSFFRARLNTRSYTSACSGADLGGLIPKNTGHHHITGFCSRTGQPGRTTHLTNISCGLMLGYVRPPPSSWGRRTP